MVGTASFWLFYLFTVDMVFITALQDKVQMTLQVEQHRELLRPQVEDKLCAVQNISVRGH